MEKKQNPKGRKSLQGGGESPVLRVRVTPGQLEKVALLGGPAWIRSMIDKAKVKNGTV